MPRTVGTILLVFLSALVCFGLVMLYSTTYATAAESTLIRQTVWILAGGIAAFAIRRFDYRRLGGWSPVLLAAVALALGYLALASLLHDRIPDTLFARLPFVLPDPTKGSFRWLHIWRFSVQPSEFAKIAIILFLADYYHRRARFTRHFVRGVLLPMGIAGFVVVLILLGRDLSTTAITAAVVAALSFIAGIRLRYIVLTGVAGTLLILLMIAATPERMSRLLTFQDPEAHQFDEGYQLWASQLALGSGSWRGLGFADSRMKQRYLPEASTDFIVAIVGEELGFFAVVSLILAYFVITGCILVIGCFAPDRLGLLLCLGIGLLFGVQALVNISVVSGFCPTTGVTAPFVSYGGSSMLAGMLGVGLVFSVLRIIEENQTEESLQDAVRITDTPTIRTNALRCGQPNATPFKDNA
ncbi:MAG: FtsW/RodA/SpoVE family cell cycle protein [Verrucomicrobiota bacterium]